MAEPTSTVMVTDLTKPSDRAEACNTAEPGATQHSLINTNFPVLLPDMPEIRLDKADFEAYVKMLVCERESTQRAVDSPKEAHDTTGPGKEPSTPVEATESAFMTGLLAHKATMPSFDSRDGKMLTENDDVTYRTSQHPLVDLFYELEDSSVGGGMLADLLESAWDEDATAALKIIWNARSIHLGKSSRTSFYRALGWLAEKHPLTLLANLPWLVRPVIQKKLPKKTVDIEKAKDVEMVDAKEADSDFELIEEEDAVDMGSPPKKVKLDHDAVQAEFDIKYGVAHGYWKDLLNILALAADDQLNTEGSPRAVLNVTKPEAKKLYNRDWTEGRKKERVKKRYESLVKKLEGNGFYKALHLTIARLFADQLRLDLHRLQKGSKAEKKLITFAAKWAPTHKGMHDQHTCIVSTIAEMLHPFDAVCPAGTDPADRELYLKHARIAYQSQTLSPLRKHLDVVERHITNKEFEKIKYDRVPSLAMKQYTSLFAQKDFENFDQYIERVAGGKSKISGAVLMPSTLVAAARYGGDSFHSTRGRQAKNKLVENKLQQMRSKVADGQWNTLVQRIRDSGTLTSSIAIADVSGSMSYPEFADGTTPMDSAIGLALLVAEVTQPPFGGAFITFSERPEVLRVGGSDDKRTFTEKVNYMARSDWGGNTDFVAVFEKLILPMAIENKVPSADMVKQLFVFSDMHFDAASGRNDMWKSSFERIEMKFNEAGYEIPRLIFWNLAGAKGDYGYGADVAPKPVTAMEENTALVSGYSQAQMKMFLDGGGFEDAEEEEVIAQEEMGGEDDEVLVKRAKKKEDPLAVTMKAIGHEAYRMLRVVD